MSTALKCDRCHNYFDYDPSAKFNFIAFGHKDIIVGKNFPVKDICPICMEQFMKWFENPDNYDPHDLVKDITEEHDRVIKSGDRRAIAHFKNKHGYTMTKEEIDIVNEDKVEETKLSCYFANCKFCASLIHERIPDEEGITAVRCGRKHKRIELSGINPDIIDSVTPEIFDEQGEYDT